MIVATTISIFAPSFLIVSLVAALGFECGWIACRCRWRRWAEREADLLHHGGDLMRAGESRGYKRIAAKLGSSKFKPRRIEIDK